MAEDGRWQYPPEEMTPVGWPRPVVGGWPVPWISHPDELKHFDGSRMADTIEQRLCQVCGLGHAPGAEALVCVPLGDAGRTGLPAPGRDAAAVRCDDDALLHESCARLALARCPELAARRAEGRLVVLSVRVDAVHQLRGGLWVPLATARVRRDLSSPGPAEAWARRLEAD